MEQSSGKEGLPVTAGSHHTPHKMKGPHLALMAPLYLDPIISIYLSSHEMVLPRGYTHFITLNYIISTLPRHKQYRLLTSNRLTLAPLTPLAT